MNDLMSDSERLNLLAHEFAELCRQGRSPAVDEYAAMHPQLADQIRDLFPAVLAIEQSKLTEPRAPSQLGGYHIVREIAHGGMGIVYEAIEESLGRHVALKVLPVASSKADDLNRFRREACAAAQLHHSNIVPVFAVGEDRGMHYYAMQFIPGQNLHEVLEEIRQHVRAATGAEPLTLRSSKTSTNGSLVGLISEISPSTIQSGNRRGLSAEAYLGTRLSRISRRAAPGASSESYVERGTLRQGTEAHATSALRHGPSSEYYRSAARIAMQIADALDYAHQQRMLHRDIKPSNILLDENDNAWIADFGLVRMEGLPELTMLGEFVGTLRYMPPERFQDQTDARGDIYSLGLTLYEMLTLRPAFESPTRAALIRRILYEAPAQPRSVDPRIPRDLETIVTKAVAREPERRYQTAGSLAEDLRRFLDDRPILARRLSPAQRVWRWSRRNKASTALATVALLLLVSITVVSFSASLKLRYQLEQTRAAQRLSRERRVGTLLAQSRAIRLTGREGQRFEALRALREARQIAQELTLPDPTFTELRDEMIAALSLPDVQLIKELQAWPPGTVAVDVDPAFQRYARGDETGNVTIHGFSDDAILLRLPSPAPGLRVCVEQGVVFSPNGRYLQQLCDRNDGRLGYLRLWDLSGAEPLVTLELPSGVRWTSFAADSGQLAVNRIAPPPLTDLSGAESGTASVRLYETKSGLPCETSLPSEEGARMAFHPNLPQLAISDSSAVRVIDLPTGAEIGHWSRTNTTRLDWSRDGQQLLAASDKDLLIQRWDVPGCHSLPPLAGHNSGGLVFAGDPAGDLLVSSDWSGLLRLWDVPSGRLLLATPAGGFTTNLRFSQDGKSLFGVTAPGVTRVLRIASGRELQQYQLGARYDAGFPKAVFSQDGRLLAATAAEATVLIDVLHGAQVAQIPGHRIPLLFDADRALITHSSLPEGLVRWPLIPDPDQVQAQQFTLGPSQPITATDGDDGDQAAIVYGGFDFWSASADGRVIAMPNYHRGTNLFTARGIGQQPLVAEGAYQHTVLGPQTDVRTCAVSPDGRWVASGSHSAGTITVWNAATGGRIKDLLPTGGGVSFTPDGRWLYTSSAEGLRPWAVGTWQPGPILDQGNLAFDRQGELVAVEFPNSMLQIRATETGQEVTKLATPGMTRLKPEAFSPDGMRLAAFGLDNGELYIWDLRALRDSLKDEGADWDLPSYPAAESDRPRRLQIKLVPSP